MESYDRREIFLALIAPIGVNLNDVESALTQNLKTVGYNTNSIRLTEIFEDITHKYDLKYENEYERYDKYIRAGDQLRLDSGMMDIFALYGIQRLVKYSKRGLSDEVPDSVAHVFRQIKRPEEIRKLKQVFGRNVIFVSCYDSKENRTNNLIKGLLRTQRGKSRTDLESLALKIMAIDEDEREHDAGQRVLDCYQHADFVLDCTSKDNLGKSSERFVNIYFGHPYMSPTRDEYCIYYANAASYRSLDLSRQVGVAIFSKDGEVISLGCNEVPRAGGGTYWEGDSIDQRDYILGRDSNHQVREDMAMDALKRLQKPWMKESLSTLSAEQLAIRAFEGKNAPLKGSMISDVMEYGRMVHAEMNAITDAARSSKSTQDAVLYSTTMPCHLCSKLIVASGIKRVVYIQPYPKSLVQELYSDSIEFDNPSTTTKVSFETLKGVTPNGYRIAFRKVRDRKYRDGRTIAWDPLKAGPIFLSYYPYYRVLEVTSQEEFKSGLAKINGNLPPNSPSSPPPKPPPASAAS